MRIGIITNLGNSNAFSKNGYENSSSEEILSATGGNTGNVAFVHAVQKIIGGVHSVVNWGDDPKKVHDDFDKLVICSANQLGSHTNLGVWGQKLLQFNLPVMVVGIGAQADKIGDIPELPEGTLQFLKVVDELRSDPNVSNLITRGDFTSLVLKEYGHESVPLGCPSLLTSSDPKLGLSCLNTQKAKKYSRIAIAAGNPWHAKSAFLEAKLTSMVELYDGEYILQHPKVMFQLANVEHDNIEDSKRNYIQGIYSNLGDFEDIASWFQCYGTYFVDAPNWMRFYKKFKLVVGPRYHGVALGIQVGIPGKVIAIDSRTEELSMTTGVPYLKIDELKCATEKEIIEMSWWNIEDAERLDKARKESAIKYVDILSKNGLPISSHLNKLNQLFINIDN
jgi:hypothetical protein